MAQRQEPGSPHAPALAVQAKGWGWGCVEFAIAYAVVAAARWDAVHLPYWCDSLGYVTDGAREILNAGMSPLIYWDWDPGHPPLYYWLTAVIWKLFAGDAPRQIFVGHLLSFGFAALGLWATYRVGRRLRGPLAGLIAAGLLFVSAAYFSQSGQMLMELPITALSTVALLCVLSNRPVGYACAASAAALMKATILPVLGVLLVLAVAESIARGRRSVGIWTVAAVLPLALHGAWWYWHYSTTGWLFHSPNKEAQFPHLGTLKQVSVGTVLRNLRETGGHKLFVEGLFGYLVPLIALAFMPSRGFWRGLRDAWRPGDREGRGRGVASQLVHVWHTRRALVYLALIVGVVFGSLALVRTMGTTARYWLPASPALFLLSAVGLRRLGRAPAVVLAVLLGWLLSAEWWAPAHGYRSSQAFRKMAGQPWDDSLQYTRCVRLYQKMCTYLETHHRDATVYGRWPTLVALDHPYIGYVKRRMKATDNADHPKIDIAVYNNVMCPRDSLCGDRRMDLLVSFDDGPFHIEAYRVGARKWPLKGLLRKWLPI